MRIRRYAARLLSSSGAAANPASAPPQPAAGGWLHAADDDCCDFCDLTRSPSPDAPDAVKHKGHIAGRAPESGVKGGERVDLAQLPPAPEAKKIKVDHGRPVKEAAALGLGVRKGGSAVPEAAAAKPEGAVGQPLVTEADAGPTVKAGPFDAAAEKEVKCGASLVSGSTTEVDVLKGAPVANEVAIDQEVKERVPLEIEAATVPGFSCIVPDKSGAELEATRTTSLLNEVSTKPELMERASHVGNAVIHPGVAVVVQVVTGIDSLGNKGDVGSEGTGRATPMHDTAELEVTGSAEPEDTGGASCNVDDAALDEPWLPKVGNAGETAACAVEPSQFDAEDAGGSVNFTSRSPVRAKVPTVEGRVPQDGSVTPSVSCVLDVVARSIGRSGRTNVICYSRRRGKRKADVLDIKTENTELDDGVICDHHEEFETLERAGPCESVMSTAGSADVKLADIKRELKDNSAARKVKKVKKNRFECDIDYCRMTFKTKTELSVHKKNICTVKSCSRHFRSHKYLRRHQSVHNDDMPYKCPWEGCSMTFKWSWDRAEHFKVHIGERPYKCTTPGCSKIYKYVSDFTRHRRRCRPQR